MAAERVTDPLIVFTWSPTSVSDYTTCSHPGCEKTPLWEVNPADSADNRQVLACRLHLGKVCEKLNNEPGPISRVPR